MMMIPDLPNDLEEEILSRVPAKSLWELKTTCKRWYALFRDPKFGEKNKKLGEVVRESMLLSNDMVYSIAGDLHNSGFDTRIEFTGELKSLKGLKVINFSHIFHCDGLMLCLTERNNRIVVWNPCTGQTRNIKPRTPYCFDDRYALGYTTSSSSSGHSYKILRRFYLQNDQKVWVPEGEIYDLISDSWRVLGSFPIGYSGNGMSLKGDTYSVARDKDEPGVFLMTKFDFTTETLVRLPLPFQILDPDPEDRACLSVVRDEKLSLLHIDNKSGVMRIWVTNKIDDEAKDLSWRSDLVLEVDFDTFNLYVDSFLLDEENKAAVVCCNINLEDKFETRIYIVGEDTFIQVYKERISTLNFAHIITYAPSLVNIQ